MVKQTPLITPTVFPNSGSKKFSAQQATIYKITFFRLQNDLEYNEYKSSINYDTPINTSVSTFPNQINTPPSVYKFNRYGN